MQDGNLEHMEYLLTEQVFIDWLDRLTKSDAARFVKDNSVNCIREFYFKEHGLPVDSQIKD